MGDWCGSAWVCWPKNQQEGSNGCGKGGENEAVLVRDVGAIRKKEAFFSYGEVFFLLTYHLRGGPLLEKRLT